MVMWDTTKKKLWKGHWTGLIDLLHGRLTPWSQISLSTGNKDQQMTKHNNLTIQKNKD